VKYLSRFQAEYDASHEATALQTRGYFVKQFPISSLKRMTLRRYVVGHGESSFCNLVESRTRPWASIQGSTSLKFGVYFGRTKEDPTRKYRFSERFGVTPRKAFGAVKAALLDLVKLGGDIRPNFASIDANPLSQMFKAKILSLYFPDRFLAVCSAEHLEMLADIIGLPPDLPSSEYQSLLLNAKRHHPVTRQWSSPKFMAYLYKVYVRADQPIESPLKKPRVRKHRRVDFEEMQKQKAEMGRRAERYALRWERERLIGVGLKHLISQIDDRRERPGYGYDFLSHSAENRQRFIEVKSVAKVSDGYRFFLSDNEHHVSWSVEHRKEYYFYLVYFGSHGTPIEVESILAGRLYPKAEVLPSAYEVRFDRHEFRKLGK
jgi:hypothetical protein